MKRSIFNFLQPMIFAGLVCPVAAQTADPSIGKNLVERQCSVCHKVEASTPGAEKPLAPSFTDVSRMPSTTELSIKVFLKSSHSRMPNIILTPEEIDSVASYIVGLKGKK